MHQIMVSTGIPDPTIPPLPLAPLQFRERTAKAHIEDIGWRQQTYEPAQLLLGFNNIVDNKVVPRSGKCGKASVISLKQPWPHNRPREGSGIISPYGQDLSAEHQQVKGEAQKGIIDLRLKSLR
jgi:hypothetical protein